MTVRGWGSSCQTCKKAENSTAAASPTVSRYRARSATGSRPPRRCTMFETISHVLGHGKAFSADWGLKACNSSGRIDTKKRDLCT